MKIGEIRAANIIEAFVSIAALLSMLLTYILFGAAIAMVFWVVEYLIHGISLIDWIESRWYVVALIFLILGISTSNALRKKDRAWNELISNSDAIDLDEIGSGPNHNMTAGIEYSGRTIGPVTVSVTRSGLSLWRTGKLRAHFDWNRFESLQVYDDNSGDQLARLILGQDSLLKSSPLVIPWDDDFTSIAPNVLIKNRSMGKNKLPGNPTSA